MFGFTRVVESDAAVRPESKRETPLQVDFDKTVPLDGGTPTRLPLAAAIFLALILVAALAEHYLR